jgi:hypothetical protein
MGASVQASIEKSPRLAVQHADLEGREPAANV